MYVLFIRCKLYKKHSHRLFRGLLLLTVFSISCSKLQPAEMKQILFTGDSLIQDWNIQSYFSEYTVINTGKCGSNITDLIKRLPKDIYSLKPDFTIVLIGTNDCISMVQSNVNDSEIIDSVRLLYQNMFNILKTSNSPFTVISLLPINRIWNQDLYKRINFLYSKVNQEITDILKSYHQSAYFNAFDLLRDNSLELMDQYTTDGLHLTDVAYDIISENIRTCFSYE